MSRVVLFGATGYTGRLTAHALARRSADLTIVGRSRDKLERLAAETGEPEIRIANVGDVGALRDALEGAGVLITCVGPFAELGHTAVQAAVEAGCHYIDSTGEGTFIDMLIERYDGAARDKGITIAPAMGFDEVPGDVAATLAAEGMSEAQLDLTYALPTSGSQGTIHSTLGIITSDGPWLVDGRTERIHAADRRRWAPMPPPLGPRAAVSFPLAIGRLAPLHLDLRDFGTYVTVGTGQRAAMKIGLPLLRVALDSGIGKKVIDNLFGSKGEGPDAEARERSRWTILAEARAGRAWRNVVLKGSDPYGLTAEFLSAGAIHMAEPGYEGAGVASPVGAVGLELLEKELAAGGVSVDVFQDRKDG